MGVFVDGLPAPEVRPYPAPPGIGTLWGRMTIAPGVRLAVCMAVATAAAAALHRESHSFWLPLTVAVAIRPEYASVYARTVNRVAGTVTGGLLAAALLFFLGSGWPVGVAAVTALGLAVLGAPRLYALSVVGLTCSALLSASIAHPDPASAAVRVVDTLLGALIALILGYLLWPGRASFPGHHLLDTAVAAAAAYLDRVDDASARVEAAVSDARDRAYHSAHRAAAQIRAATLEPPPVDAEAEALVPIALAIEDLVDDITATTAPVSRDQPGPATAIGLRRRLTAIEEELAERLRIRSQPTDERPGLDHPESG